eukprot:TRINITY_DN5250_c0_g1_i5.p1 TRINITY_DN5250_c0_g1~~TRINITY_DN5250_c0_g1_i5.p1  ORF type:complete len:278 (+),score=61.25 TRINITY_DN5250_c0_g1_i5:117-950(+)
MIRRPPRSTLSSSSAASDVYKRQARKRWECHCVVGLTGFVAATGKSTFCSKLARRIEAAGRVPRPLERVSQDVLGTRNKCVRACQDGLRTGCHVIIDRCNFDRTQRGHWLKLSKKQPGCANLAIVLHVPADTCVERVMDRTGHETLRPGKQVPGIVQGMANRFAVPVEHEGYEQVYHVHSPAELDLVLDALVERMSLGYTCSQNTCSQNTCSQTDELEGVAPLEIEETRVSKAQRDAHEGSVNMFELLAESGESEEESDDAGLGVVSSNPFAALGGL